MKTIVDMYLVSMTAATQIFLQNHLQEAKNICGLLSNIENELSQETLAFNLFHTSMRLSGDGIRDFMSILTCL